MKVSRKNAAIAFFRRRFFLCVLMMASVLISGCHLQPEMDKQEESYLKIVFIDVGQGDAALLISPSGRSLLIDCGSGQSYGAVTAEMRKHDVQVPDLIIGTHAHDDHVGSLPGLLKNIGAKGLYLNGENDDSRLYQAIVREATARDLAIQPLVAGDMIQWDREVQLHVFGPYDPNRNNRNNSSVVLQVRYGAHRFLFTGDAESEEELEMLRFSQKALASHVVKVPHHGSASSSTPSFVQAVHADVAVISVGKNDFGHPNRDVLARWQSSGAEVYTTEEMGSMTFESDGKRLWMSSAQPPKKP